MEPIPLAIFAVFALSLPRGLGFGDDLPVSAWKSSDGITVCALTKNVITGNFGVLVMRRQVDDVWVVLRREADAFDLSRAMEIIGDACGEAAGKLPVPPGVKRRPPLVGKGAREFSEIFKLLAHPCRRRGASMLNELYLAMPNPDANWASDCRTGNFHTRLWEALLFASLKEQGLWVDQNHPSPDFYVRNRTGDDAWIEAVTTNPVVPYDHAHSQEVEPPLNRRERMLGVAAERYAKTLKSKMDKAYVRMDHVVGKPFAIAIADFHAPGSMVWSRVALMAYLYGFYAKEIEVRGKRVAVSQDVHVLPGAPKIPAGLFFIPEGEELSAVIFSQGATLAKLSRVPYSFDLPPDDYRYVRFGELSDFTPGALRGVPFCMDVNTDEYRALWAPYDHEPWTAEMEVFHNPNAKYPLSPALLPEATHWLSVDGVLDCKAFFQNTVLKSKTLIQGVDRPVPTVDDLVFRETTEGEE